MKKLFITLIFSVCIVVSFIITRNIKRNINNINDVQDEPVKKPVTVTPERPKFKQDTLGTLSITSTPSNVSITIDDKYVGKTPLTLNKQKVGNYKISFSTEGYQVQTRNVTVIADSIVTCSVVLKKQKEAPKYVKISLSEVKSLIAHGTYEKDHRFSKKYRIEYIDVSDDDEISELQQNFTFVQQRVEFETWRDFEVVGIGYDEKSGLVNVVKIRPIY